MIWRNSTRKRYESLGYNFTKYGDDFYVKVEDLPEKSEMKITAICEYCGKEKEMTIHAYNSITKNKINKYRCRDCFKEQNSLKYSTVLSDAKNAGYEVLTKENEYVNGYTYIKYICPIHGEHEMRASNLHAGRKCPECRSDKSRRLFAFSPNEVYEKVTSLGGELLNKEDYVNLTTKNLDIICPRCKTAVFTTSLRNFCQHGGQSCPECYRKESIGERLVRQWLEKNKIYFIQEKWFPDCRDINPLPFDFYLPDKNTVIEFDGQQHFQETHYFSRYNSDDSITSYTQYHDSIKTDYCNSHNINLIRIPYTKINDIENILQEKIA